MLIRDAFKVEVVAHGNHKATENCLCRALHQLRDLLERERERKRERERERERERSFV
jgi:hypothetical protein